MALADKALWMIDRNLREDLTLSRVAQACGVSRYHLAHAFGETTGMSVMEYARTRRLSEAASALAAGAGNILALAMDYGYASHEAFSRAFQSRFGVSPDVVRRNATTDGLALVRPLSVLAATQRSIEPQRLEPKGDLVFVGRGERIAFSASHTIAALWEKFMPFYAAIEDKADPIPWGLSTDLDDDGNFDYICAVQVTRASDVPKGLEIHRVPARTFAVFRHDDHASALPQTYAAIWNGWAPQDGRSIADAASLERHLATFDTRTGLGGVEIYIPLA